MEGITSLEHLHISDHSAPSWLISVALETVLSPAHLMKSATLTALSLSDMVVDDGSITRLLLRALEHGLLGNLQELKLQCISFQSDGAEALKALCHSLAIGACPKLSHLDLSHSDLDDGDHYVEAVKVLLVEGTGQGGLQHLRVLKLRGPMVMAYSSDLADTLRDGGSPHLELLDLSGHDGSVFSKIDEVIKWEAVLGSRCRLRLPKLEVYLGSEDEEEW